jgi:hypothetical protein
MMIMPANNTSGVVHYLAGAFPGRIGMLLSPSSWKRPPWYMPFGVDNGAFTGFKPAAFVDLLCKIRLCHQPLWVAVPDKVADPEETNRLWRQWCGRINYPLAFVAQDGHLPQDIPRGAAAVFVGGSTDWKLTQAHTFKGVAPWLHIGRVNTARRLEWAEEIGADSVDGTGFFRSGRQRADLIEYVTGTGQRRFWT